MRKRITIKKICLANGRGQFIGIDTTSGGYPFVCDIDMACLYNKRDRRGRKELQNYLDHFSNSDKNSLDHTLFGFRIVTIRISYDFRETGIGKDVTEKEVAR